jgi:hypothetical protein
MATPPAKAEISDTYPNPSNAVARVGFAKLWETLFGTGGLLGTTGTPADARAALGIGPVISNRNRLINGGFGINQRGVSGSVVLAAGAYGHDRWKAGSGGCTYTFATTGGVTTITIVSGSLMQVVEPANVDGGAFCLSWTGTATGRLNNTGAYASGPLTGTLTGGVSAYAEFTTGTLANVQLEPGSIPTPFERRPIALEQSLCQRYYQLFSLGLQTVATAGGQTFSIGGTYPVLMRATPTTSTFASGLSLNTSAASLTGVTNRNIRLDFTSAAAGATYVVDFVYALTAEL